MVGRGGAGSGKIRFYFRSGEFKAEPKAFIEKLHTIFHTSIDEGTDDFVAAFTKTVARKSGALRRWFKKMITKQSNISEDVLRVTLKFKPPPPTRKATKGKKLSPPYYFRYHIPAFAPKTRFRVGKKYKKPTISGTEPISVSKVMRDWSSAIEKRMAVLFAAEGMKIKTAVKAKWYRAGK